jgi:transposase-like protein
VRRKRYTAEQRAEAVALAVEHGAAVAAAQLGIAEGTVRSWQHRTPGATEHRETTRAAAARRAQDAWTLRRASLADEAGATAGEAMTAAQRALKAGKALDAQRYASTFGAFFDRAEKVAGPVPRIDVGRPELDGDALKAETAALIRQLREMETGPTPHPADT